MERVRQVYRSPLHDRLFPAVWLQQHGWSRTHPGVRLLLAVQGSDHSGPRSAPQLPLPDQLTLGWRGERGMGEAVGIAMRLSRQVRNQLPMHGAWAFGLASV